MFQSPRDHLQGTFLHVSIPKGSSSGNIPACFNPQGIIFREHSYMFRSTRDHIQGTFLHVSIPKGSYSENIPICFNPQGIIFREHSYMFQSPMDHIQRTFLYVSINGSVTWTLTQTSEHMLNTFERKVLRGIYGPSYERGCWRFRWNNELYSLYKELNVVEDIKIRRLEWAGHIIRMEEERIPKKRF
jgi:hypothetical protein